MIRRFPLRVVMLVIWWAWLAGAMAARRDGLAVELAQWRDHR